MLDKTHCSRGGLVGEPGISPIAFSRRRWGISDARSSMRPNWEVTTEQTTRLYLSMIYRSKGKRNYSGDSRFSARRCPFIFSFYSVACGCVANVPDGARSKVEFNDVVIDDFPFGCYS